MLFSKFFQPCRLETSNHCLVLDAIVIGLLLEVRSFIFHLFFDTSTSRIYLACFFNMEAAIMSAPNMAHSFFEIRGRMHRKDPVVMTAIVPHAFSFCQAQASSHQVDSLPVFCKLVLCFDSRTYCTLPVKTMNIL